MTRATMRTLLRRALNEILPDQFDDATLNIYLNEAVHQLQISVMKFDPDAFIWEATAALAKDQELYDLPTDLWQIRVISILDPTSAKYIPIEKGLLTTARAGNNFSTGAFPAISAKGSGPYTSTHWFRMGQFLGFSPVPVANLAAGFKVTYVPTLGMALDTDVPPIHVGIHYGIVLWAVLIATGETAEATQAVRERLATVLSEIPNVYGQDSEGSPPQFNPQIDKRY